MEQAKVGDTVRVHFTARLKDGTVVSSTENEEPLEFTIGQGEIIPGIDEAVVGMRAGDSKSVWVPFDKGFGPHQQEMVTVLDRKRFPSDWKLEIGKKLEFPQENGDNLHFFITDVSEATVTLDANHPLAGKDLTFDLRFVEIS